MADQKLCHARGHVGATQEYEISVASDLHKVITELISQKAFNEAKKEKQTKGTECPW